MSTSRRPPTPRLSHVPRRLNPARPLSSPSGRCLGRGHSRHTASSTARITGPMNRPTKPKVARPPSTPNSTTMKGICAPRLMSSGRTKWSVHADHERAPAQKQRWPATVWPVSDQPRADAAPQQRHGERDDAADGGERGEEDRRADAGEPVAQSREHPLHQRCQSQPVDHRLDGLADGGEVSIDARPQQLLERARQLPGEALAAAVHEEQAHWSLTAKPSFTAFLPDVADDVA